MVPVLFKRRIDPVGHIPVQPVLIGSFDDGNNELPSSDDVTPVNLCDSVPETPAEHPVES